MNDNKPTPLQDVRKGLGLLFRAAKTAVGKLPAGGVEEVVATSAREVGRAIENVATAIELQVFGRRSGPVHGERVKPPAQPEPAKDEPQAQPKPPDAA
jgi:hypothetical protein